MQIADIKFDSGAWIYSLGNNLEIEPVHKSFWTAGVRIKVKVELVVKVTDVRLLSLGFLYIWDRQPCESFGLKIRSFYHSVQIARLHSSVKENLFFAQKLCWYV